MKLISVDNVVAADCLARGIFKILQASLLNVKLRCWTLSSG